MPVDDGREVGGLSGVRRAHAVLHCNLNTVDLGAAEAFYSSVFGLRARMRSVSTDSDATAMGLGPSTASDTCFLFDGRGPRAAPALELVQWHRPATVPAVGPPALGFVAAGYRVPSLAAITDRLGGIVVPNPARRVCVRGRDRPAVWTTDPDGVSIEIVEVEPGPDDPDTGLFSHERLRCADLARTVDWYAEIGFVTCPGGAASLVLPEDPTFSLEFEQPPNPVTANGRRGANDQGLYRIALAVDDVRGAHAELRERHGGGIPEPVFIPMPDVPTGGFTVLFLADPDGAVVELVERPRSSVRRPAHPA